MNVRAWHDLSGAAMAPLYEAEAARWHDALGWDTSASWSTVETARTTWGLPGFVCVDAQGVVRGWTFFMAAPDRVDVGGLTADSAQASAALIEALVARAGAPDRLHGLIYGAAPGLTASLADHRIAAGRYAYLARPLQGAEPLAGHPARAAAFAAVGRRPWSADALDATADLLRCAHDETTAVLPAGATIEAWRQYVGGLVRNQACGTLAPELSSLLTIDGRLAAVALVSLVSARTAHLVQIAVHPDWQGSGLGRTLLAATLDLAAAAGHTSLTLLVGTGNQRALRMYGEAGFVERGAFVALRGRSALAVDQRRGGDAGHDDAAVGGERRLAAL